MAIDAMAVMPRCEKTSVNSDLHLVAYEDADTGENTASILGADYRHLVCRTTTLRFMYRLVREQCTCPRHLNRLRDQRLESLRRRPHPTG